MKQTIGSIGYVEYIYARANHIAYVLVQSRQGTWPQPTALNFAAAAAGANWAGSDHNFVLLLNQPGSQFLADHRRDLYPGPQEPEQCCGLPRRAEILRLGL